MSIEKRQHERTALSVDVRLSHESFGEIDAKTRDLSDGGVYVWTEGILLPPAGSVIQVQVQGIPDAAIVPMKIMRKESEGAGLMYWLEQ